MNERTRYRTTGALFLLSVGVIFVPMLFDRDDAPPVQLAPVNEDYQPPVVRGLDRVPESDFAARVEGLRAETDEQGFHRGTKTKMGEPVLSAPNDQTDAWAVQLGSFASADKARAFRDRLRADGYEAFLSSYKPEADVIRNRVAVGPLLDAERAERLAEELSGRYEVEARLMAFGN